MEVRQQVVVAAVPATTREVVTHVTCDLCGSRGREPRGFDGGSDWHPATCDWQPGTCDRCLDIVTVQRKVGYANDADGRHTTTAYHVCPGCWESVLVPLFAARGARATISEVDW